MMCRYITNVHTPATPFPDLQTFFGGDWITTKNFSRDPFDEGVLAGARREGLCITKATHQHTGTLHVGRLSADDHRRCAAARTITSNCGCAGEREIERLIDNCRWTAYSMY